VDGIRHELLVQPAAGTACCRYSLLSLQPVAGTACCRYSLLSVQPAAGTACCRYSLLPVQPAASTACLMNRNKTHFEFKILRNKLEMFNNSFIQQFLHPIIPSSYIS
jgi:hypothetical protein